MSSNYPVSLDNGTTLPNPGSGDPTNSPSHAGLHDNVNGGLIAVQTKVGIGAATPIAGQLLRGNGTNTSTWGQLVLSTDVAAFSSSDLRGVISDETGTGVAVFGTGPTISAPTINSGGTWGGSPTITTPTIASFTNSQHNHSNAAGGGQLTSAGIASFDTSLTATSNPYKFSAYLNSAQSVSNSTDTIIAFDTELFDSNNNFDVTTNKGRYTAPVSGFYQFDINISGGTGSFAWIIGLKKNGTDFIRLSQLAAGGWTGGSAMLQLAATNFIEVYAFQNSGSGVSLNVGSAPISTAFHGFFVSTT